MVSRMKVKILVQNSASCTKLLRYINNNAQKIRDLGVTIRIEKLSRNDCDGETISKLQKKGIVRLPALIAPDGTKFIGIKSIIKLLESNFKSKQVDLKINPIIDYNDVHSYMNREIMSNLDESGKPKNDREDMDEDNNVDFASKMADYARNTPKHRRNDKEKNVEIPTRPARNNVPNVINHDNADPDDYDNIDMDDTPNIPINTDFGDDVDRRMMEAWKNNLG